VVQSFAVPIVALAALITGALVWPEFFDLFSLLLTLGGSLFVTWISYSNEQLRGALLDIGDLFTEAQARGRAHADELARLSRLHRLEGLRGLENQERSLADPFLRRCVGLLVDLQKEETIRVRLERELADISDRHDASRQILLTLGKLLPAFGLIGTLIGMVLLLRHFTSQDSQALTNALSLAVLTTLYGALLGNAVVAPLAARLHALAAEQETKMSLTADWVLTIARGESAAALAGKTGGFFLSGDTHAQRARGRLPLSFLQQR